MTGPLVGSNLPNQGNAGGGVGGGPSNPTIVRTTVGIPKTNEPGGVGRRWLAMFIDGIIIGIVLVPIDLLAPLLIRMVTGTGTTGVAMAGTLVALAIQWGARLIAYYFFYGYFYSVKGATPGKALMGLKVVNFENGTYLTYGQSFLREVVGKLIIDTLTLGIGYLMAAFRDDKRALHDIVFKTQVIRKES